MNKILTLLLCFFFIPCVIFSSESDIYDFSWLDPDKEVYVLQNRKFRKNGRPYVNAGGGVTTSGAFVNSSNLHFRGGFFFREEWGIEGIYSLNYGKENETAASLRGEGNDSSTAVNAIPFRRIVQSYYGAMLLWSPFYNKINTFNKVFYMDWMFGLGYGTLNEEHNEPEYNSFGDNKTEKEESHSGFLWQTALQFYLTQNWNIRLNLITMNYSATIPSSRGEEGKETSWNHHYDLSVSLGMIF